MAGECCLRLTRGGGLPGLLVDAAEAVNGAPVPILHGKGLPAVCRPAPGHPLAFLVGDRWYGPPHRSIREVFEA